MGIFKAAHAMTETRAVPFRLEELGEASRPGSDVAERMAADIIAQAHADAAAIRRKAQDEGRAAALDAAERILEAKVTQRADSAVSALRAATERILAARSEWLSHWEKTAIHVAAAIAGRLVRRELQQTPEITLTLVREALELAVGACDVQVRMHPDDYQALGAQAEQVAAELARLGSTKIVPDPLVTQGGCRVETRHGAIDQQFEAQLARIEQELI
jgi:flagellar assembly protein FliH